MVTVSLLLVESRAQAAVSLFTAKLLHKYSIMGTSSGTLQGIESLDATLSEIERKLNIIENAHVKIGSDQNDDVIIF